MTMLPTTPMTTPTETESVPPPLPNPAALLERTRLCRGRLHAAKSASVLRNLRTVEQEKTLLLADYRPGPLDGAGRPGGPVPADHYVDLARPALAALDAVGGFESAISSAEQLSAELSAAFTSLDTALRAADGVSDEALDPGRVELLTSIRRQLDGARREHLALLEDLEDAKMLTRSFLVKAERLRSAAIAVTYDRIVADIAADLDRARRRVDAIRASTPSAVEPVRALAARWEARLGEPVRLPKIIWPAKGGPFDPPELGESEET
jgi:hypothetical protein